MFELTMNDSRAIQGVFDAVAAIIDETEINFNPNGISLTSIDAGRVCLISLNLDKEDFDAYKCDKEEKIGLNIEDLVKILKRSSVNDSIVFQYADTSNKLVILMQSSEGKKIRKFSITLKDISMPPIKPESLEKISYNNSVSLPIGYLQEAIKDADIYNDTVIIRMNDQSLVFRSEGNVGDTECIMDKEDTMLTNFVASDDAEGTFALKFLNHMLKVSSVPNVTQVEVSVSTDQPLKASFNIMGASSIKYYLAPRIEDEDEEY
ncbi:MAG: proliferating cell nuclear antigen (pcna) [Candidatus Lokiarchaeota archaeon]|nr:proliferating cell nuclear antigen (pcna) [Candidatus Lokiarchaeota archaeon]